MFVCGRVFGSNSILRFWSLLAEAVVEHVSARLVLCRLAAEPDRPLYGLGKHPNCTILDMHRQNVTLEKQVLYMEKMSRTLNRKRIKSCEKSC
jgi:hypothetical protein